MPQRTQAGRRVVSAWRRLHREEEGIALVLTIVTMLVLTITLSTVMFMTAAGARDAHRSNAGQRASALAESGINNSLAVLNESYASPTVPAYPGDTSCCPRGRPYSRGCTAPVNNCVTWSGTLVGPLAPSAEAPWKYEWRLTATGAVTNPTGPTASAVTRRITAIVPVVIPTTSPVSGAGPLNFLYSGADMWFLNSVHVKAPVYVTRGPHLESTAVIDGEAEKAAIGRDLYLKNPQNQIGSTGGSDPRIPEVHVVNQCSSKKTRRSTPADR